MCTTLLLTGTFAAAVIDWLAVGKGWRRVELFAKPVTMIALFGYLMKSGGLAGPLLWFGLGVLLSLAGDVFLLFSERWFIGGLFAFLLAHVFYILGFNAPLPPLTIMGLGLAFVYAIMAARIYRRIATGLVERGKAGLRMPVLVYSAVITIMLLSATLTLFRVDWTTGATMLAFTGGALFFISDVILAFNRFVQPVRYGRVMNMAAYHLGQIALIVGVVLQFKV